jgi:hypothetical protein
MLSNIATAGAHKSTACLLRDIWSSAAIRFWVTCLASEIDLDNDAAVDDTRSDVFAVELVVAWGATAGLGVIVTAFVGGTVAIFVGASVSVSGTGVEVGVGGTDVAVAVAVGTGVAVFVGGIGVEVGTTMGVGAGVAAVQPANKPTIKLTASNRSNVFNIPYLLSNDPLGLVSDTQKRGDISAP